MREDEYEEKSEETDGIVQLKNAIVKKVALKLIPIMLPILLGIIFIVLIGQLFGPAISLIESIYGKEGTIQLEQMEDDPDYAKTIREAIKEGKVNLSDSFQLLSLDDSDLIAILDRVVEHNKKKFETSTIYYEWYEEQYLEEFVMDSLGNQIGSGSYKWMEKSPLPVGSLEAERMHVEGEKDASGSYMFDMHWTTIFVLAGLMSYNNYEQWQTNIEDSDMDDYYLSDTQLQSLMDVLSYNTIYHYDAASDSYHNIQDRAYEYEMLKNLNYRIGFRYEDKVDGNIHSIQYHPESAPNKIYNAYESWEYIYEKDNITGGLICTARIHKRDAMKFVEVMKPLFPDIFENIPSSYPYDPGDMFFEFLLMGLDSFLMQDSKYLLPDGIREDIQGEITYYEQLWEEYKMIRDGDSGPIEQEQTADFPSHGVIFSTGGGRDQTLEEIKQPGGLDFDAMTEFKIWIGEYAGHIVNGWYAVTKPALSSLTQSDGLDLGQIRMVLSYFEERAAKNGYSIPFQDAAEEIHQWQQETGNSVLGIMAIILTEGGFGRRAAEAYNFFNFVPNGGDAVYQTTGRPWANFKAMTGGDIGLAMKLQLDRFAKNWFGNGRGQVNYYLMCWKGYYPEGMDPSTADEESLIREANSASLIHSYCPWYDDTGYLTTGYNASFGWCNANGRNRDMLQSICGF